MNYHKNVDLLCRLSGIDNSPETGIPESQLGIVTLTFGAGGDEPFVVSATEQNRGGRLFIQVAATCMDRITLKNVGWTNHFHYSDGFIQTASVFFSDIWGDSSPTKRMLLYGIATYRDVKIEWKEAFFDK